MSGPNPLVMNPWRECAFTPIAAVRNTAGLTLTSTTAPDTIAMGTNGIGLKWDETDTTTNYGRVDFVMPFEFAESDGIPQYDFHVSVIARKLDAASDENADLAIQAQLYWFTPAVLSNQRQSNLSATPPTIVTAAGSWQSLTTPAKVLMAAAVVAADNTGLTGFARYELDIGARIRAEGKILKAGDYCALLISPNEAVGSGDMDLEIMGGPMPIFRRTQEIVDRLRGHRDL